MRHLAGSASVLFSTPIQWALCFILCAITIFVGATVAVALFHPDARRRADARGVLRDLIGLLRHVLRLFERGRR